MTIKLGSYLLLLNKSFSLHVDLNYHKFRYFTEKSMFLSLFCKEVTLYGGESWGNFLDLKKEQLLHSLCMVALSLIVIEICQYFTRKYSIDGLSIFIKVQYISLPDIGMEYVRNVILEFVDFKCISCWIPTFFSL